MLALAVIVAASHLLAQEYPSDAIFVPDTKASTAGIHLAKIRDQLGTADEVTPRLRTFPNGATPMRELAATEVLRPIGCTQATEIIGTGA